jgi:hypothetical protein
MIALRATRRAFGHGSASLPATACHHRAYPKAHSGEMYGCILCIFTTNT